MTGTVEPGARSRSSSADNVPGRYLVRRQRERGTEHGAWLGNRMIAD
ncbi:hypothetical protein [Streptomyces sp. NPDC001530]